MPLKTRTKLKCLSLFSNAGIAEAYFEKIGVEVVLANELLEERAKFYKHLYPHADMVAGDITCDSVRAEIVRKAKKLAVDFVIATPPCQGMSRHGKRDAFDERNQLIYYAIDVIKKVQPKFVLLENVPRQLVTQIDHKGKRVLIPEYIKEELEPKYRISPETIFNSADFGVPQSRKRCIFRMVRRDVSVEWDSPKPVGRAITLKDAIGDLPSLDPLVREEDGRKFFPDFERKRRAGLEVSKWHYPPIHGWKHVNWMLHTPSGRTAFENKIFYPQKDGGKPISGRISTYKRFAWNKPANTITQNNGVISSAICVHPGRLLKDDGTEKGRIYSDPRTLTIYELLLVSSLPPTWNIPEWASEKLIRNVIGEGIPPLLVRRILDGLVSKL